MNQMSNLLKSFGVKKGDRVAIYMPTCPMAVITMLACTRIGAVHSVVFAGFSAESLAARINDCKYIFIFYCEVSYFKDKSSKILEKIKSWTRLANII